MVWYSYLFQNFPQFIVIHTVKGFGVVNKTEIDVFLELSCFFDDPADVDNLISGSNEYSGLISFRIDWFDLLAVQGTLEHPLQHCSSRASTLWCSAFFMVQISHPYMTTGKIIPLIIWTFVGKVMPLLFNTPINI